MENFRFNVVILIWRFVDCTESRYSKSLSIEVNCEQIPFTQLDCPAILQYEIALADRLL